MGLLDNFPHLANAYVRTRVSDELGGGQDSFGLVFSNRRCWRQNASDREIQEYSRRGISVTNRIYFLSDPGLDETHVVEVGGDFYEVISHSKPDTSSGLGVVWRVMVNLTYVSLPYVDEEESSQSSPSSLSSSSSSLSSSSSSLSSSSSSLSSQSSSQSSSSSLSSQSSSQSSSSLSSSSSVVAVVFEDGSLAQFEDSSFAEFEYA